MAHILNEFKNGYMGKAVHKQVGKMVMKSSEKPPAVVTIFLFLRVCLFVCLAS